MLADRRKEDAEDEPLFKGKPLDIKDPRGHLGAYVTDGTTLWEVGKVLDHSVELIDSRTDWITEVTQAGLETLYLVQASPHEETYVLEALFAGPSYFKPQTNYGLAGGRTRFGGGRIAGRVD